MPSDKDSDKLLRKVESRRSVLKTHPFEVEELCFSSGLHPYYRLNCPDWVNILPLTDQGEAILIRQFRAGSLSVVLETPGGVVDPDEKKDPTLTAKRELEEETGYSSQKLLYMGSVNPNPALQNNRVHFFVAFHCVLSPKRTHLPDPDENIQVQLVKSDELSNLVRTGQIDHALSAHCILLAEKYVNSQKRI
ncbi:MAG: NUDIX hydrolase [Oligoflexales bacterium]|nr:NUDIX hydrolase [Oligoflexales bacterium]